MHNAYWCWPKLLVWGFLFSQAERHGNSAGPKSPASHSLHFKQWPHKQWPVKSTQDRACVALSVTVQVFLLPSETLMTEWLCSVTETPGPLVCAISWLQVSVLLLLPQYLLQLQFLDSCVGRSL